MFPASLEPRYRTLLYLLSRDLTFIYQTTGCGFFALFQTEKTSIIYVSENVKWTCNLPFGDVYYCTDDLIGVPLWTQNITPNRKWDLFLMDNLFDIATMLYHLAEIDILVGFKADNGYHIFSTTERFDLKVDVSVNLVYHHVDLTIKAPIRFVKPGKHIGFLEDPIPNAYEFSQIANSLPDKTVVQNILDRHHIYGMR
jgi:hypothetical protein